VAATSADPVSGILPAALPENRDLARRWSMHRGGALTLPGVCVIARDYFTSGRNARSVDGWFSDKSGELLPCDD
jgi:hypothetical protein